MESTKTEKADVPKRINRKKCVLDTLQRNVSMIKDFSPGLDIALSTRFSHLCIIIKGENILYYLAKEFNFNYSEVILTLDINIDDNFQWKTQTPFEITCVDKFSFGKEQLKNTIEVFFSEDYKPKATYKTQHCAIYNSGPKPKRDIAKIIAGDLFPLSLAERALSYAIGDEMKAVDFIYGDYIPKEKPVPFDFHDCPLLYLVLEIVESINQVLNERYDELLIIRSIPMIVEMTVEELKTNVTYSGGKIMIHFSSNLLSAEIAKLYGFGPNEEICIIEAEVDDTFNWKKPLDFKVYNQLKPAFIGQNFIEKKVWRFFNKNYQPSESYIICKNPAYRYEDCPLMYLILEIAEELSSIQNRCCICGRYIPIAGIKLDVCSRKECIERYMSFETPIEISAEIKRDPDFIEFLLTMASCAVGTKFLDPKPNYDDATIARFFDTLSPIEELANMTDAQIISKHGDDNYKILRFFIMNNRAHMVTMKGELTMKQCGGNNSQFLMLMQSQEREKKHDNLKLKYGSAFLWHGSSAERWYRILHTGLLNLTGTSDQANGKAYGPGIYLSNQASFSFGYTGQKSGLGNKRYKASRLPTYPHVLALTENAKTPGLVFKTTSIYTQVDVDSCAIRFFVVANSKFNWDTISNPPSHIPTGDETLTYLSKYNK